MVSKYLCDRLDWPLLALEGESMGKWKKKEMKEEKKIAAEEVECSTNTGSDGDERESRAKRKRAMEGFMQNAESNSRSKPSSSSSAGLPHISAPSSSSSSSAIGPSSSGCAPASSPPDDFYLDCCQTSERTYRVSASRPDCQTSRTAVTGGWNGIMGPFNTNEVKGELTAKAEKVAKTLKISHDAVNDGASSSRRGAAPPPPPPRPSEIFEEGARDQRCRPRRCIPAAPAPIAGIVPTTSSSNSRSRADITKNPKGRTEKPVGTRGRSAVRNTPLSPALQPAGRSDSIAGRSARACVSTTGSRSSATVTGRKAVPVGQRKVGRPPKRPRSQSRSLAVFIAHEVSQEVPVPEKRKRGRPRKV